MIYGILVALIPFGLSVCVFFIGYAIGKSWKSKRETDASLTVLSGMLAALAILVPLLAASSPWSKSAGLRWWFLLGVLSTGVVGILGTIYCMIRLQGFKEFAPNEKPYVPATISGTWICLIFLGACVVASTFWPGPEETGARTSGASPRPRFAVAHDLPELHTDRRNIELAWGSPESGDDQRLVYKTNGGSVVFCLDGQGFAQKIIETQEVSADAVKTLCK